MTSRSFAIILFLACYTQVCFNQENISFINYSLTIPVNIDPTLLLNNSSTLIVEVENEYIIGDEQYDFDTYEYYVYDDGEFILDPYVHYTACDKDDRPELCYDDFEPVCAYLASCPDGACTQTLANKCYACADPTVDWFINGACEDIQSACPSAPSSNCTNNYDPVCAVASECTGEYCSTTVVNSCQACNYPYINYLLPGQCPNITNPDWTGDESDQGGQGSEETQIEAQIDTYCDANNRPVLCTLDYNPVCAHQEGCQGEGSTCSWTAGNKCTACHNTTIDYFTDGVCLGEVLPTAPKDPRENQKVLCDPNNRPISCPLNFQPVCAFAMNCTGDGCNATTVNPCVACSIINADYYLYGQCPGSDQAQGQNEDNNHGHDDDHDDDEDHGQEQDHS